MVEHGQEKRVVRELLDRALEDVPQLTRPEPSPSGRVSVQKFDVEDVRLLVFGGADDTGTVEAEEVAFEDFDGGREALARVLEDGGGVRDVVSVPEG